MSFSIDDYALPPIRCYADAKLFWEGTKPWRGDSDQTTRPLSGRKRNQTIRPIHDGSFACRLHQTDVVIYHPNGDVEISGYPSVSTDAFANRLTPSGVATSFNNAAGYVIALSQDAMGQQRRFYRMENNRNSVTIRRNDAGGWEVTDTNDVVPFNKYKLDLVKKNRAFKEYDIAAFKSWVKAREAMGNSVRGYYWAYNADHHGILQRLMNTEAWEGIYQEFGRHSIDVVTHAIYRIENCVIVESVPYLEAWNEIKSVVTSVRKYAYLAKGI